MAFGESHKLLLGRLQTYNRAAENRCQSEVSMEECPIILSLETATRGGSVCLARGNQVLATRVGDPAIAHSGTLLRDIEEVLKETGSAVTQVDLFAAASGPGSFTGLRIGLATVKAFSASLHRPCVGIPTLEAIAHAAGPSAATVALLPAGRGELFAQLLTVSPAGDVIPEDPAGHLSPAKVFARYEAYSSIIWAGEGAHQYRQLIREWAKSLDYAFTEVFDEELAGLPRMWKLAAGAANLAIHVSALALQQYEKGNYGGPQSLKALYVRPSDAELKINVAN